MKFWIKHIVFFVAFSAAVASHAATDFMPHQNTTKEFNETWSYQFVFDNGTRAFVNYSTLYIPATGKKVACDLTFWNFKGKTYTVGRQYPPERLAPNKSTSTIDIKGEYKLEKAAAKGHHVLFTADKNGKFLLDVVFESAEQGRTFGKSTWPINNETLGQVIHIPYGRVTGKIAYNDDTLSVKGFAYMDQTWQTTQAVDLAVRSINFSTNSRLPMYAGRLSITPQGKLVGYAIYNGESGVKVSQAKSIEENGSKYNGKTFPKGTLKITWEDESIPPLEFSTAKPYQKASILDKVDGWIAKKAFKIAAGGEVLFYRGQSSLTSGKKLEWSITGIKD
ncbi:MAG: hypothetical protein HUK20_07920 [Fibrobacter sp.]|nr:hypothetical protein [Fibrobacter sp.]